LYEYRNCFQNLFPFISQYFTLKTISLIIIHVINFKHYFLKKDSYLVVLKLFPSPLTVGKVVHD